jgi:hypothetical protein
VKGLAVIAVAAAVLAGCGSGSDRLSATAYQAQLAKISKQAAAADGIVDNGAPSTVAQLQPLLRRYAAAGAHIGDELSKLRAPKNAEAANAELARGEHDNAAAVQALVSKLAQFKTLQQAFAYAQKLGHNKGVQEKNEAKTSLRKMGYTQLASF